MLVAHLRGLLKPNPVYGVRSQYAEDLILEGLQAELSADNYEVMVNADISKLPVLNMEGKTQVMERVAAQIQRCSELRTMDVYKLAEGRQRGRTGRGEISLYRLYQIADKEGILAALSDFRAKQEA